MPESAFLPEFSRRRLLLSGLVAIPAATVLAATAARPGIALAASTRAPRPAWSAADSAPDASCACFC
ncbi:MAG TPA: hypothetical protein VFB06_31525 [Streptosporangiaceae bacterium]|nr:hypothetical protein [Streptosporangiaceae bacterium]